ncbi:MAG: amidohydrolase family protein [Chloroflexi bacterium]|nr:amidohydrolase family protein [Chloroflexota bacterium]
MMLKAWDADGHVYESEATFSDSYWDPTFKDRRPVVVEANGTWLWLIDGRPFPVTSGPNVRLGGTPATKGGVPAPFHRQRPFDPVDSSDFQSAAARLAVLDREGIALQVNYPTMLLSWPLAHTPGLGAAIARSYNNWMADISGQAPDRLKWVALIDPGDPKQAAREIYRTKAMGSVGVMVWGVVGNRLIDHPELEPIWAAAADTDLTVAVHVGFSSVLGEMYFTHADTMAVPFVFPLLMGFHSIIAHGLLDRYPRLRVGFLEAGCQWLPFMLERVEETSPFAHRTSSDRRGTDAPPPMARSTRAGYTAELEPEAYIKRGQIFVGFEVDEPMLPYVIERYGDDFLFFASDIPHNHRLVNASAYLEGRTDLSPGSKHKLLVENTARLYGWPVPAGV